MVEGQLGGMVFSQLCLTCPKVWTIPFYSLTVSKTAECVANSVDLDQTLSSVPCYLGLHCLPMLVFVIVVFPGYVSSVIFLPVSILMGNKAYCF